MEKRVDNRKEVKNAFLKMSLKKAPVSSDNQEKSYGSYGTAETIAKRALYINQTTKRDRWQG